jgi:hydroxymethylpyrimidine pyrophosphatase-like HAD family hydrolase
MLRAVYVDLDGTLLGPRGSLFAAGDGSFDLAAARALQACARAGVEVVICSGRKQVNVFDVARLIGQRSYIFELGAGLVLDGELEWLAGGLEPSPEHGTIWEQIRDSGAPELLSQTFSHRLEAHTPWAVERDVSHLFRGEVDCDEATRLLAERGFEWLRLVDNGVAAEGIVAAFGSGSDLAVETVHVYHLSPSATSKAHAVARHMQNRGYAPAECIAIGDSREDLETAPVVGEFWLVANALQRDPALLTGAAAGGGAGAGSSPSANVRIATEGYGAGVYEAVVTKLAER